jgi:hypothetical protein
MDLLGLLKMVDRFAHRLTASAFLPAGRLSDVGVLNQIWQAWEYRLFLKGMRN